MLSGRRPGNQPKAKATEGHRVQHNLWQKIQMHPLSTGGQQGGRQKSFKTQNGKDPKAASQDVSTEGGRASSKCLALGSSQPPPVGCRERLSGQPEASTESLSKVKKASNELCHLKDKNPGMGADHADHHNSFPRCDDEVTASLPPAFSLHLSPTPL